MINSVTVHDLYQAIEINTGNKQTNHNAWITATDVQDKNKIDEMVRRNQSRKIPHLALYFMDISYEDKELDSFIKNAPQKQDVEKIIAFIKTLVYSPEQYNLGVNCFAGVSRSTSIALIARFIQGDTPAEAWNAIERVRPMLWPNLRILKFASEILKDNSLYDFVKKHLAENKDSIYIPVNTYDY